MVLKTPITEPPYVKFQLSVVRGQIIFLNFLLYLIQRILFLVPLKYPKNILIFKIGNIGDTVCSIPAFIAIRRFYPDAKISLLSSPGRSGIVGAKEFFTGAWYFNDLKIYYSENVSSFKDKVKFIKELKKEKYDLFIQLPDDLADFKTLLRNMIFAKFIGVKGAFGFKIRTIQLFKKTQVDFLSQESEVLSLLRLLDENGITTQGAEFDFNITENHRKKITEILSKKWGKSNKGELLVILNPGGKREANRWPAQHFGEIGKYLQERYRARIIIVGGKTDISNAEIIGGLLNKSDSLILTGQLELLELVELLKRASFLISNDTGAGHIAAAVNLPVVGLYCIRNVFGRWVPYGENHEIIYHKFIDCDYREEECIKRSIEMISVNEVRVACDRMISRLKLETQ